MPIPQVTVDLSLPPERRWEVLAPWRDSAAAMLEFYLRDLGGAELLAPFLADYRATCIEPEYVAEMRGVASVLGAREDDILVANLYYDALKVVLGSKIGCTAFAVDTPRGPIHARNLDWLSANGRLASETLVVDFRRGNHETLYRTVTWPGFIGCLSGLAPGRFGVTLNAVLSDEPPELAPPIALVLRQTLERAPSFDAAVATLSDTPVASDSLLLVSGTNEGEAVVVERTPTRASLRRPTNGALVVTNDYRTRAAGGGGVLASSALGATACARFDRATALIREAPPQTPEACLRVLTDRGVKMGITVQHMVLSPRTGTLDVVLPE